MDKLILLVLFAVLLPLGASYVVKPKTTAQLEAEIAIQEDIDNKAKQAEFDKWYEEEGRFER